MSAIDPIVDQIYKFLGLDKSCMEPDEIAQVQVATSTILVTLQNYTARNLVQADWIDTFYGDAFYSTGRHGGRRKIVLAEYPVISITSVTADGVAIDPSFYDVDKENGLVRRVCYGTSFDWWIWDGFDTLAAYPNIVVTYSAGFVNLPADLIMLISDFVGARLRTYRTLKLSGGQAVTGEVSSIQIEGVGKVMYRSGVPGVMGGYGDPRFNGAISNPILGAGTVIADLYRDVQKILVPDLHEKLEAVEAAP